MSASLKTTMPRQVAVSINELLDRCAEIKAGQEVLIVAAPDGLTGGYNVVDEACVAWIQAAVQQRGAHPALLWVDILSKVHAWRVPPVLKAAVAGANVVISHAFDLPFEELYELRDLMAKHRAIFVRNMATTAKLLASDWAQTPYALVSEIRIRAAQMFKEGLVWTLTHDNGTRLTGKIRSPLPAGRKYADRRTEGFYRPFPEGVFSPVNLLDTEGTLIFNRTSPWWARYINVPCHFATPVQLTIENNRIRHFDGGDEAKAMERFLAYLAEQVGESIYEVFALHGGVHPHAKVGSHQCSHETYREFIDHHHSSNLHLHLGVVPGDARAKYPYFVHVTGDLQGATLQVGDRPVYDHGRLTVLDLPEIKAITAHYPDQPGV